LTNSILSIQISILQIQISILISHRKDIWCIWCTIYPM